MVDVYKRIEAYTVRKRKSKARNAQGKCRDAWQWTGAGHMPGISKRNKARRDRKDQEITQN
jgi:hypothetical protein